MIQLDLRVFCLQLKSKILMLWAAVWLSHIKAYWHFEVVLLDFCFKPECCGLSCPSAVLTVRLLALALGVAE